MKLAIALLLAVLTPTLARAQNKEELALAKEKLGKEARSRMYKERVSSGVIRYFQALAADQKLPVLHDHDAFTAKKVREWPEIAAWVEIGYGVEFSQQRPPHPSIAAIANGTASVSPLTYVMPDTTIYTPRSGGMSGSGIGWYDHYRKDGTFYRQMWWK